MEYSNKAHSHMYIDLFRYISSFIPSLKWLLKSYDLEELAQHWHDEWEGYGWKYSMLIFNPEGNSSGDCRVCHYVDLTCEHWWKQSLAFYLAFFFIYTRTLCDICWQQNAIIKLEYWFIAKDYAKVMLMVYLNPQKMEIKN